MDAGRHWLHPLVGEEENPVTIESPRFGGVFKLDRLDGHPAFDQWHRQTIKRPEIGVGRTRPAPLKHQRIRDDHTDTPGPAVPGDVGLIHCVESVDYRQDLGGVGGRDRLAGHPLARLELGPILARVASAKDPLGPGHHLVLRHLGPQERRNEGAFPVGPVVEPGMVGIVLDRVVQKPDGAPRPANNIAHRTIFKIRGLKRPLSLPPFVDVRRSSGPGPDLSDEAISADLDQARFGADDVPVGVVDQAMGRDVALDLLAQPDILGPDHVEDLLQGSLIEMILQERGPILRFGRGVGRHPILLIIITPLALKPWAVTGSYPELGLFEVHRLHPGGDGPFDSLGQEIAVVDPRAHVVNIATVRDLLAVALRLRLVLMVRPVEPTIEIILVLAPRDAGHQVRDIPLRFPARDPVGEAGVDPVADRHVGPELQVGSPLRMGLKRGALAVLVRIRPLQNRFVGSTRGRPPPGWRDRSSSLRNGWRTWFVPQGIGNWRPSRAISPRKARVRGLPHEFAGADRRIVGTGGKKFKGLSWIKV